MAFWNTCVTCDTTASSLLRWHRGYISHHITHLTRRVTMGNVQVLSQNTSNNGELTEFQKNKLMFDFNTFFDLNNDGYLSYKVKKDSLGLWFPQMTAFLCVRISSGPRIASARCLVGRWTAPSTRPRRSSSPTSGPASSRWRTLTMTARSPGMT